MLKTNSKKARENVRNWIIKNFDDAYCCEEESHPASFAEIKRSIYLSFYNDFVSARTPDCVSSFIEWMRGLPGVLNTLDILSYGGAVDTLADILNETKEEKNKYIIRAEKSGKNPQDVALDILGLLIYREITKKASKKGTKYDF